MFKRKNIYLFIAILGPDGSGKTSISNYLKKLIEKHCGRKIKIFHWDFGNLPRLGKLKRLFIWNKKKRDNCSKNPSYKGSKVKVNGLFRGVFNLFYYSIGYMLGYIVIWNAKKNGEIIIADRYFYDYYYQKRDKKIPTLMIRSIELIIPKPRFVFCLMRDPKQIEKDKPELFEEDIIEQQEILKSLANKRKNWEIINCSKGVMDISKELFEKIKEYL